MQLLQSRQMQRHRASFENAQATLEHGGFQCFGHALKQCICISRPLGRKSCKLTQHLALIGSSGSLHSEACNAVGASDGVIQSSISQEAVGSRAAANSHAAHLCEDEWVGRLSRLESAPSGLDSPNVVGVLR